MSTEHPLVGALYAHAKDADRAGLIGGAMVSRTAAGTLAALLATPAPVPDTSRRDLVLRRTGHRAV